ncbi:MAG: hypothetical protein AAF611_05650 [Bacteroidota bacterium]
MTKLKLGVFPFLGKVVNGCCVRKRLFFEVLVSKKEGETGQREE